jgi:hypothetical protein
LWITPVAYLNEIAGLEVRDDHLVRLHFESLPCAIAQPWVDVADLGQSEPLAVSSPGRRLSARLITPAIVVGDTTGGDAG